MSAGYANLWGSGQQHSNATGGQQREGRRSAQPASAASTPPLTPVATHPAPRAGRRAAGL
jgi:hypothetical protein